jgi:hypothetical protein
MTRDPDAPVSGGVTATGLGSWPGTDPVEASRIVRGELGAPNLPHLVSLPGRGAGSDDVGRTAALLVDLAVDIQPHGWRLVPRPGQDYRRAVSALGTDLNVLGDLIGAEEDPGPELKIHFRGPVSMVANLHLHGGERALQDYGARREISQSLAAGAAALVERAASVARGASIVVQMDEPDAARALAGRIPTASGYRTLRALPQQEATEAWRLVLSAVRSAGAAEAVLAFPAAHAPLAAAAASGADGFAVPLAGLDTGQWEWLAGQVEDGRRLWAGIVPVRAGDAVPRASALVHTVLGPWRQLGLAPAQLAGLRVTPDDGLAALPPGQARHVLGRLTQAASALGQVAAEG